MLLRPAMDPPIQLHLRIITTHRLFPCAWSKAARQLASLLHVAARLAPSSLLVVWEQSLAQL